MNPSVGIKQLREFNASRNAGFVAAVSDLAVNHSGSTGRVFRPEKGDSVRTLGDYGKSDERNPLSIFSMIFSAH